MLKRIFKILLKVVAIFLILILALVWYVSKVAMIDPPTMSSSQIVDIQTTKQPDGLVTYKHNWFRKSESGLYEVYVEGDGYERGVALGALTKELVQYQEQVFTDQLYYFVPSNVYRKMLTYMIGWFNRDLPESIPQEFKEEIFGVSQSASTEYNDIALPYQRMLNYHGAHDIGHALQNMSLVGCTSFAVWGDKSSDSTLLIGRNFDFYLGDDFARDKIVAFYKPTTGHPFMMVTFGGMTGVLSGMNTQGITVTINAAKSDIPKKSATPVSLVAREILQYASTIDEAYAIAAKRELFVSETFLIGSAKDKRAGTIEKSLDQQDSVRVGYHSQLICTNHFQSPILGATVSNVSHMETSASYYRYRRVKELLNGFQKLAPQDVATILRDQHGLGNVDIGLGNEKSINQLVAHHSIVFQPERGLVWVSTDPWQLGAYVCYDLNQIFSSNKTTNEEIHLSEMKIDQDPFIETRAYTDFLKFSPFRFVYIPVKVEMQADSLVYWNPESYLSYKLAADHYLKQKQYAKAAELYTLGLSKEIATLQEKETMQEKLSWCNDKLK